LSPGEGGIQEEAGQNRISRKYSYGGKKKKEGEGRYSKKKRRKRRAESGELKLSLGRKGCGSGRKKPLASAGQPQTSPENAQVVEKLGLSHSIVGTKREMVPLKEKGRGTLGKSTDTTR